jgi:hypothetical protein
MYWTIKLALYDMIAHLRNPRIPILACRRGRKLTQHISCARALEEYNYRMLQQQQPRLFAVQA